MRHQHVIVCVCLTQCVPLHSVYLISSEEMATKKGKKLNNMVPKKPVVVYDLSSFISTD